MSEKDVIAGVGMIPVKKPGQSETYDLTGAQATRNALEDAGLNYDQIQSAYAGYVYGDSCCGQAALYHVGITGIPVVNVTNNCGSGTTAFSLAAQAVEHGMVECALAAGVKIEDRVWVGMPHVFQAFGFLPEAQKARRRACRFLLAHTREAPVPAI